LQFAGMYYQKSVRSWDEDILFTAKSNVEELFKSLDLN
jgi:hypothetical protein